MRIPRWLIGVLGAACVASWFVALVLRVGIVEYTHARTGEAADVAYRNAALQHFCERVEDVVLAVGVTRRAGTIARAGARHCYNVSLNGTGSDEVRVTIEIVIAVMPDDEILVQKFQVLIPAQEYPFLLPVENEPPALSPLIYFIIFERAPSAPATVGDAVPV